MDVVNISSDAAASDGTKNDTKSSSPNQDEEEIMMEAIKTELATPYYLCVGKHSLCILDRNMSGDSAHGGYLARIPFRAIQSIFTCASEKDALSINMIVEAAVVPMGCSLPPSMYVRSSSTDRIVQQLQICWKADNMYRTLSVSDLLIEKKQNLLVNLLHEIDEDCLPDSWISDDTIVQREGFSAQAPMPQLKMFETRSYSFYAPKDFVQVGRKDSGHFVRGTSRSGGGGGGGGGGGSRKKKWWWWKQWRWWKLRL